MGNMNMSMKDPTSTAIAPITYDALFVVNGGNNSVSVINTETNTVVANIALQNASFPHHLYLSPDRTMKALAVPGMDLSAGHTGGMAGMMGSVMLMDAKTGATMKSRMLEAMNHNAIFSPDGKEIWTTQMMDNGTVLVLDASSLATMKTISVGAMPAEVTFSRDGKYAFVCNGASNNVSVIDVATKGVVKTIAVGKDPVGAWQGTNNVMYVDNEEGKSVTAIDAQTLNVVRTYNLGFTPAMAATAPNGELWITDTDNGKVVFYALSSDAKLGELATGAGAHAITFSGDGKTAYITNQNAGNVSVIDVATKRVTKTLTVGSKPNGAIWRTK
ncbi:MAG: hypothetical protein MUF71_13820 [Candidatus Kapabacteria bacterium]|nr:hypothetical protein [Candidatus Kapabacteria bacterium]